MKWITKYKGFLRRVRLLQYIYNRFHKKGLEHNKHFYNLYQIKKSIYDSVSHRDFKNLRLKSPWMDRIVGQNEILNHPEYIRFPEAAEAQLLHWHKTGFLIWENFLDEETINSINFELDELIGKNKVQFNYTSRKIFNAYKHSYTIRKVIKDKRLLQLFHFIMERNAIPFQTINFMKGSEQKAHSDSIHMSTFPEGNLVAAWFALEDIGDMQGPVFYYPGSQDLPYIYNEDYPNDNTRFLLDENANEKYEAKVQEVLNNHPELNKVIYTPKKGDLLIWHANMLHGAEPIKDYNLTRKSMVVHYFGEDVVCYHEISERPAIFDTELVGEVKEKFFKGDSDVFDIGE